MAKKKTNANRNSKKKSGKVTEKNEKSTVKQKSKENIAEIARSVLTGEGKNPYYYGGITIQNFHELLDYLQQFSENEVKWLADWIDYLGDDQTAEKIRETPSEFRTIINHRYQELKRAIDE
jgi:hypothetical protein